MTTRIGSTTDYYRLLGVSPDATLDQIRAAYRRKIRLWHPDLLADKSEEIQRAATEVAALLNEAYEYLSDPHRRATYDGHHRATNTSRKHSSPGLLVVSPRTLRCEVTPGDAVRFTLNVQADTAPDGDGPLAHTADRYVSATSTLISKSATSATLEVRVDTSRLAAHRTYHVPVLVTWGSLTGAATLEIHTSELHEVDFTPPPRPEPDTVSHGHWTRPRQHRIRDLATISLGGIVVPVFVLAWALGRFPVPVPGHPRLVAFLAAAVVTATTWLLITSRLLRNPQRLARTGVAWGHLMRWLGWAVVGTGALVLGIAAVASVLTVVAVIAAVVLGLGFLVAFIGALFDS